MTSVVPGAPSEVSGQPSPRRPSFSSTPSNHVSNDGDCIGRVSETLPVKSSEANSLGLAAMSATASTRGAQRSSCGSNNNNSSRPPVVVIVNAGHGNTSSSSSGTRLMKPDSAKGWRGGSNAHGLAAGGNARHGGHAGGVMATVNPARLVGGTSNGGVKVSAGGG